MLTTIFNTLVYIIVITPVKIKRASQPGFPLEKIGTGQRDRQVFNLPDKRLKFRSNTYLNLLRLK